MIGLIGLYVIPLGFFLMAAAWVLRTGLEEITKVLREIRDQPRKP